MSQTKRFFIALLPPLAMQDYANQVRQYFSDHYASRKAFNSPPHITLQPPFEWDMERRDELLLRLTEFAAQQSPAPITLSGFGAFPPRVIFIDVARSPELLSLQAHLSRYCANELGLADRYSSRPFSPHMTVAFRDLTKANFHQAWPEFADKSLELTNTNAQDYQFVAAAMTLLQHDGQVWQIDRQVNFAGD